MGTRCCELSAPQLESGRTKFTTSGAHDVIAITSPQKNNLCTEELRDIAKSLDEVGLPLKKLDSVVCFKVEKGDSGADSCIKFHLGRLF